MYGTIKAIAGTAVQQIVELELPNEKLIEEKENKWII
jgi:hypothetical protein